MQHRRSSCRPRKPCVGLVKNKEGHAARNERVEEPLVVEQLLRGHNEHEKSPAPNAVQHSLPDSRGGARR